MKQLIIALSFALICIQVLPAQAMEDSMSNYTETLWERAKSLNVDLKISQEESSVDGRRINIELKDQMDQSFVITAKQTVGGSYELIITNQSSPEFSPLYLDITQEISDIKSLVEGREGGRESFSKSEVIEELDKRLIHFVNKISISSKTWDAIEFRSAQQDEIKSKRLDIDGMKQGYTMTNALFVGGLYVAIAPFFIGSGASFGFVEHAITSVSGAAIISIALVFRSIITKDLVVQKKQLNKLQAVLSKTSLDKFAQSASSKDLLYTLNGLAGIQPKLCSSIFK